MPSTSDVTSGERVPPSGLNDRLDRYDLLAKVGEGGFGTVYKARHRFLEHIYALKVMPPALRSDAEAMHRFEREVQALRALDHPSVVKVHDAGIDERSGSPYLAMSFVDGETLHARLETQGPLAIDEAVRLGIQMAEALQHIHTRDTECALVHRDVKPGNIILTTDDEGESRAVLTDFGIAFSTAQPRITQGAVGTPEFMSPEQAEGLPLDARSDLYSLGVVLYESLTGTLPFEAENESLAATTRLLNRILTEPAAPPSAHREEIPEWLDAAILRCLAKERDKRYISAAAFAEVLRTQNPDAEAPADALVPPAVDGVLPTIPPTEALTLPDSVRPASRPTRRTPAAETPAADAATGRGRGILVSVAGIATLFLVGWLILSLARGTDSDAAAETNQATAQEQRIERLISEAEAALADERLTKPDGNSAHDKALAILDLDPENEEAREIVQGIVTTYEAWGDEAGAQGDYAEAIQYYEDGLSVDSTDAGLRAKLGAAQASQQAQPAASGATGGAQAERGGGTSSEEKKRRLGW